MPPAVGIIGARPDDCGTRVLFTGASRRGSGYAGAVLSGGVRQGGHCACPVPGAKARYGSSRRDAARSAAIAQTFFMISLLLCATTE